MIISVWLSVCNCQRVVVSVWLKTQQNQYSWIELPFLLIHVTVIRAWCKSGTRMPGPWTAGPPSKFKIETRDPLKFKSGTPGSLPSQSLKVEPQVCLQSLRVAPLRFHHSLMNSFFFRIFYLFSYLFFFSSFLNNKHYNIRIYLVS